MGAVTGSFSETNTKLNTSTDEYVVQRGEGTFAVKFKTLEEAFASVPANGVETPVKLLASIEGEGTHLATLDEGKNVVLDMNGKTLSFIVNQDEDSYVILNKGTLTMKESTGLGGGISMGSTITLSESRISTIIKMKEHLHLSLDSWSPSFINPCMATPTSQKASTVKGTPALPLSKVCCIRNMAALL